LPSQIQETDYHRRKQILADRAFKLKQDIENLEKKLETRLKPKTQELSSRPFIGSVTDYVRYLQQCKDSQFTLSRDTTEERDVELKRKIDKCVEAILQTYGKDF
jgi:hypothetical protein